MCHVSAVSRFSFHFLFSFCIILAFLSPSTCPISFLTSLFFLNCFVLHLSLTLPSLLLSSYVWMCLMRKDKLCKENKPRSSARLWGRGPGIKLYTFQLGLWRCGKIAPFQIHVFWPVCLRPLEAGEHGRGHPYPLYTSTSGLQGLTLIWAEGGIF